MYRKQIFQKVAPSLSSTPISKEIASSPSYGSLSSVVQRVQQDPNSVSGDERQELESAIGSRSTREILAGKQTSWVPEFQGISAQLWGDSGQVAAPIQAKLTIGEAGDKYEQEADQVAKDVVQQINTPQTNALPKEDSAQIQPNTLQRQQANKEELQRKHLPEIVQRREAIAAGEASRNLESAINSTRGSGQPLDASLQKSMGQAMGTDFSGVRVHTDAQADQLNQSIQAKAFTTGKDLFFRQGEYQPGSRGGQELIAHELTHVLQQNSAVVQSAVTQKHNDWGEADKFLQVKNYVMSKAPQGVIQRGGAEDTSKDNRTKIKVLKEEGGVKILYSQDEKYYYVEARKDITFKGSVWLGEVKIEPPRGGYTVLHTDATQDARGGLLTALIPFALKIVAKNHLDQDGKVVLPMGGGAVIKSMVKLLSEKIGDTDTHGEATEIEKGRKAKEKEYVESLGFFDKRRYESAKKANVSQWNETFDQEHEKHMEAILNTHKGSSINFISSKGSVKRDAEAKNLGLEVDIPTYIETLKKATTMTVEIPAALVREIADQI
ncbi:hypothetical protein A4S05_08180 [Nostoc sp. KVJ20]|uniref:eCIS core domain-containing protein n=1 Tax=Nostoc sp. KVJ20 TaxID=457944 RepID=UPI00083E35A5|nr:DUF4157 domain-containing protein [Nostoc sp. KVJ20]ODG98615.1 hypothetical protein A4S05_08180 [Nostoc sp. KVJ20]